MPRGSVKPSDWRSSHISSAVAAWTIFGQVAVAVQRSRMPPFAPVSGSVSLL